ncbi:MAG: DUF4922 domain-containing protein [Cyanobacteria bacterium P01_A01_bin.37]
MTMPNTHNHDLETPSSSNKLWDKIQAQATYAIACGALQSIPTHHEWIEQGGVSFLVRSLDTLARKEKAKKAQNKLTPSGKPFNPFLPYETDLFVTHLSETHLCLLNKYNVVDHHLLIVTRAFEEQETWLNQQDFAALWQCLSEIDGLAFYNGGKLAGASQPHKHMQLVPILVATNDGAIPIEAVFAEDLLQPCASKTLSGNHHSPISSVQQLDTLPFNHAIAQLAIPPDVPVHQVSSVLVNIYHQLLDAFIHDTALKGDRQTLAYNLLATRRWMMVVPRTQESYASISVNSLGFAGSLFVKDENQLQILRQTGPMTVLQKVAQSKPS